MTARRVGAPYLQSHFLSVLSALSAEKLSGLRRMMDPITEEDPNSFAADTQQADFFKR